MMPVKIRNICDDSNSLCADPSETGLCSQLTSLKVADATAKGSKQREMQLQTLPFTPVRHEQ